MRKLLVPLVCGAALTLLALLPGQGDAAWMYSRYYVPYSTGYVAPTSSTAYYYGSYYSPSTAYYYPSTAYYYPSTALYSPSLNYYYGANAPTTPYSAWDTSSMANYYYPYARDAYYTRGAYLTPGTSALAPLTSTYTYGAYLPRAAADYYAEPAPAAAVVPAVPHSVASVSITDDHFEPRSLTIAAGTTVRWVNNGSKAHTVTSDSNQFDSGELNHNSTFSHTFDRPGTFYYHCNIEPNKMRGEVIVR